MDMREALKALDVRDDTLSAGEKAALDRDGYLALPGLMSHGHIEAFRRRLAELTATEGELAGTEVHQERGTDRLSDLINKDPIFTLCFTHPRVLTAIRQVLGPEFKLSSLNSRAALPGHGLQALHADWGEPVAPGAYLVCNSIWLLDDFTTANGATRVLPGSHRSGQLPRDALADAMAPHPDEVLLTASAGTVVVFNAHVWHGGTLNRTAAPRRALHAYFCRRDQPQQLDQRAYLRPETRERLTPAEQYILAV